MGNSRSSQPGTGSTSNARRQFLKGGAAVAMTIVAPGLILYQTSHAGSQANSGEQNANQPRWGMLIDTNALTEADADRCVDACQREHGWNPSGKPETDAQWIRKIDLRDPKSGHRKTLPMMCQHCEDPPCVHVCPTGASFKRADGIVLVDKHSCIGCRYCMLACPYKARSFIHENISDQLAVAPRGKGTVESCTLCVHRIDRDGANAVPACAEAVRRGSHKPILFGDLNDPGSEISRRLSQQASQKIRADLGLNPGVRYQGL